MDTLKYIQDNLDCATEENRFGAIEIGNFGRNELAELLPKLEFKTGLELGVAAGRFSEVLCKANPQMQWWGVDIWEPYMGYRDYMKKHTLDNLYDETKQRMAKYPNYQIIRAYSSEAVKQFADDSLDFLYIDANHALPFVINDIDMWLPKIRKGGIISGHDFVKRNNPTQTHVVEAVTAWTKAYGINPWFILGREGNNEGLIRDKQRSWMWVAQ